MSLPEDIRYYLSRRIAFLLTDIDKCHREIEHLNKLLRTAHCADISTVPPIPPPVPEPTPPLQPHPAVRPLARPKLNPTKSTPDLKPWPRSSDEHPAYKPSVGGQSRYPRFPKVFKLKLPSATPFKLHLHDPRLKKSYVDF